MKLMPAGWCYYLLLNVMRGGLGWRLVAGFPRRAAEARGCCLLEPSLVLQVQQVGKRMLLYLICRVRGSVVWTHFCLLGHHLLLTEPQFLHL